MASNFHADLPECLPEELVTVLAESTNVRVERIVSLGHASDEEFWYDQAEHEFVLLLQGAARLQFENRVVEMKPGDWIDIRAHERHRVAWTTRDVKTVWLAVYYR